MWVFSVLMACWSFSLLMRWVSEAVARRRKRLVSQRSTKSFWLGLVLIVICAGVAVFAGYMAVYLEGLFTRSREQWTTPIAIVGGGVALFGIFLLIMACVGDRARGRVRCPKCWYDMSDAAGLQCPECGHRTKHEKLFTSTRRPRWAMVLGLALVLIGSYPIVLNKKTVEYGPLAMMPTWVLTNWWEELPEEWVVRNRRGSSATLQDRISLGWISESRLQRFGNKLTKPMMSSKAQRWDPIRTQLLVAVYIPSISSAQREAQGRPDRPDSINFGKLLELLAFDQLEALTTSSPTAIDTAILERTVSLRFSYSALPSTYEIARYWIVGYEDPEQTYGYGSIRFHLREDSPVTEHLHRFANALKDADLSQSLLSEHRDIDALAFRLITDANSLAEHADLYINAPIPDNYPSFSKLQGRITYAFLALPEESQGETYELLNDWLNSENHLRVALSIGVITGFQRILNLDHTSANEHYQQIVNRILDEASNDPRTLYPDGFYKTQSVRLYAQRLIIKHTNDPVGDLVFPMIRQWLEQDGYAAWISDTYKNPSEETAGLWLDSFEKFANSPDPLTRRWVIHNLPSIVGTVYDDRLNQIVLDLLDDSNTRVARGARLMKRVRKIKHRQSD